MTRVLLGTKPARKVILEAVEEAMLLDLAHLHSYLIRHRILLTDGALVRECCNSATTFYLSAAVFKAAGFNFGVQRAETGHDARLRREYHVGAQQQRRMLGEFINTLDIETQCRFIGENIRNVLSVAGFAADVLEGLSDRVRGMSRTRDFIAKVMLA